MPKQEHLFMDWLEDQLNEHTLILRKQQNHTYSHQNKQEFS
jgi:hypothetical protein